MEYIMYHNNYSIVKFIYFHQTNKLKLIFFIKFYCIFAQNVSRKIKLRKIKHVNGVLMIFVFTI